MKKILLVSLFLTLFVLTGCSSATKFAKDNASVAFETLLSTIENEIKIQEVEYVCYVWEASDDYVEKACNYFIIYTHKDQTTPRYAEVIVGIYDQVELIRDVTIYLARVEFMSAKTLRLGEHADNLEVNAQTEGVKLTLDIDSLSSGEIRRALRAANKNT